MSSGTLENNIKPIKVLLDANSDDSDKMKSIKKAVKTIHFKKIPPPDYCEYILKIF